MFTNMDGDKDDDASTLSSASPHYDQDYDDNASSWPSIYYHQERFMTGNEQGVTVMGFLQRITNSQYIPWVREWSNMMVKGAL